MPTFLDNIAEPQFLGIPVILWFIGFIILAVYLYKRKPKEKEFKPINTEKEVKSYIKRLFTTNNIKTNKRLTTGLITYAYILGYCKLYWDYNKSLADNLKAQSYPIIINAENKDKIKELYGLRVCKNTWFYKILAKYIGLGINYFIVDKELLTFYDSFWVINPHTQPSQFFGINIYSDTAKDWIIQNAVYKIIRQNELDAEVNFIQKQTFLEVETSRNKAQLDILEEVNKEKRKEQLEQIKKA